MPKTPQHRTQEHKCPDCDEQLRLVAEFIIQALDKRGITAFAWDRSDLPAIQQHRAPLNRVN
jgi:hypothetical protein